MLKKTLSLFLALLLCASGCVVAFASGNAQAVTGEAGIINPVFKVSLPLNLDFKIDPLKMKGQSQIFSGDTSYNIVNKTTAPVKVDLALKITATGGVTFKADDSTLNTALPSGTTISKDLYIAIQGAESIDITKSYANGQITTLTGGATNLTAQTASGNVVPVFATAATTGTNLLDFETTGAEEASGTFSFLVDAGVAASGTDATDATKNKPTATSMTSFRLYSKLNTYADWDASDFELEGSFDFIAVSKEDDYDPAMAGEAPRYSNYMLDTTNAPALVKNVGPYVQLANLTPDYTFLPGPLAAGTINTNLNKANVWTETNPLIIQFDSASKPTSINALASTSAYLANPWIADTDYAYNASTGLLTVKKFSSTTSSVAFRINSATGAVIVLNFN